MLNKKNALNIEHKQPKTTTTKMKSKSNKHINVRTAYICEHIIVNSSIIQYSTKQF